MILIKGVTALELRTFLRSRSGPLFRSGSLLWIAGSLWFSLVSCRAPTPIADAPSQPDKTAETSAEGITLPPLPPPNSYLAHLPPDATNRLVNLGIRIAIPTYLPSTMALANYGVGETAENGDPYYWLVYRDEQNRCFAIEYAASDIDDSSLENQEPLNSALFGDNYRLYHGKFPNGGEGELAESDLLTDWLAGDDGFYRLVGAGLVNAQDYGQGDCSNIAVKDAIAITESLSYLPTDIRTLELAPNTPDIPTPDTSELPE